MQTRPADLPDAAGDTAMVNQIATVHTEPDHPAEPVGEPDRTRSRTRRQQERDDEARTTYTAGIQAGTPLSERGLANRYGRGRTWAHRIIAEAGDQPP